MPELPEVEVTRRGIEAPLRGARIRRMRLGKALRWPLGRRPAALQGLVIGSIVRRGKYLWMPLADDGAKAGRHDAGGLLWHLGMSGSLALVRDDAPVGAHDHVDLVTDRGTLRLTDPRRFGAVVYSRSLDVDPAARLLGRLGAEPFDPALTAATLHARLARRHASIKSVLLAGDVVVGAGNIYACEALFAAGIHPALRADRISRPRAARLLAALRTTLERALQAGGSTLRDFHDAHGAAGAYQAEAAVYAREGEPCPNCAAPIRRRTMGQRSTYFCARCQKR